MCLSLRTTSLGSRSISSEGQHSAINTEDDLVVALRGRRAVAIVGFARLVSSCRRSRMCVCVSTMPGLLHGRPEIT